MTSWVYKLENFKLNHFLLDCSCIKIYVKLYKLWTIKSSLFYGNTCCGFIYIRSSNREKQIQAEELKKYSFPSVSARIYKKHIDSAWCQDWWNICHWFYSQLQKFSSRENVILSSFFLQENLTCYNLTTGSNFLQVRRLILPSRPLRPSLGSF